jgi:mRNA-degrading endonuclease RelE of RelBE toxin-antitoxin system
MIIKEVVFTPDFKKDFDKLKTALQNKVREILKSIEYDEKIDGVFHIPLKGI